MHILLHLLEGLHQLETPIILMFDYLLVLLLYSYYLFPNCFIPSVFSLCVCHNYLKPFIMILIQFSVMSFLLFDFCNVCISSIMVLFQFLVHFLSFKISFLLSFGHFIIAILRSYFLRFIFLFMFL